MQKNSKQRSTNYNQKNTNCTANIYQNLISCSNCLYHKEEWRGLCFDITGSYGTHTERINKMHTKPQEFYCDFLSKDKAHFLEILT
jgi:hypothetical protein